MKRISSVLAVIALSGCATITPQEALHQGLSLSPEHFAETASVQDDSLDTIATISTEPGFQVKHGLAKQVIDDNWIRALIKKKTGAVTYEVVQQIRYSGQSWRFYDRVNYETPAGPKTKPVMVIDRNVDCDSATCWYYETVAFTVDKSLLQNIAKEGKSGAVPWHFKFTAQHGEDFKTWMSSAEIEGLMDRVAARS